MINALPALVLQTVVWPPTRLFLGFFTRFEVRGLEHLPKRGPVVFAANHASELDPILVPAALPFLSPLLPIIYVAKRREFYEKSGPASLIYGGFFFKLWGAYPVREGLQNYALSLSFHIAALEKGKSLLIFPEGGITPDGSIGRAHGGVAYLAWESKAPVIPIAISSTHKFSWRDMFLRRRKLSVTFLPPLRYPEIDSKKEPSAGELRAFADSVMEEIRKLV